MTDSFSFLSWLLLSAFGALAAVTLYRVIQGSVQYRGLLSGLPGGGAEPERIQAVAIAAIGAAYYGFLGVEEISASSGKLPDLPELLIAGVGLSQLTFLGGKFYRIRKKQTS